MKPKEANEQRDWMVNLWRIYLLLGFALGVVSLAFFIRVPSEAAGSRILGLTPSRLIIAAGVVAALIVIGWLSLRSWRERDWFEAVVSKLDDRLSQTSSWGIGLAVSVFGFFGGAYALLLTPEISEPYTKAYFYRLAPLIFWLTGLSLQTLVMLLILRGRAAPNHSRAKARLVLSFALLFGVFFGLWSWLVNTQFESESKVLGWNETGTPLLETQVLLAWVIGMLLVGLAALLPANTNSRSANWFSRYGIDVILGVGLWLSAVLIWNSIPLTANWFLSKPEPPNFEFYPNSDALTYDLSAQQLLVGEGFQFLGVPFARRPMHTLYLSGLRAIAGQDYEAVVTLQIAVLSLLPVVVYLLTKSIHQRFSGIIAALLILLREANSIAMAGVITTAHAKLLMVDLPATLCVVSFILAMVVWLKSFGRQPAWALVAGGLLGICILIRVEFGAMILASLLVLVIFFWKSPKDLVKNLILFGLGLTLLLSPWIWRNYEKTGLIFIDSPSFRIEDVLTNIEQAPTKTQAEPVKEEGEITNPPSGEEALSAPSQVTTSNQLVDYFSTNISRVASYMFTHTVHSQLQTILSLPTTFRPLDSLIGFFGHRDSEKLWEECCSAIQYPRRLPYWFQWDGRFPQQALAPLLLNVMIMMMGVYTAWKNYRLIGLLPLIFAMTHILTLAIIRKSGGRYILPADWIGLVYFSIGLATLTVRFLALFWKDKLFENPLLTTVYTPHESIPSKPVWRQPSFYIAILGIFLVGCSLPIVERITRSQYDEQVKFEMLGTLVASELLPKNERQKIEQLVSDGEVVVDAGRALYPRFYRAGAGEPGTRNPMGPLPYARLGFYLAGPTNKAFILPLVKKPAFFPNGSDVVVLSDFDGDVIAVGIFENSAKLGGLIIDLPDDIPDSN